MGFLRLFRSYKNDREREIAALLSKKLHVPFNNIDLYVVALRHKSAARNIHNKPETSNERLEFLGDAVLDAAVADYLYQKYPSAEEGEMTKVKSRIVSRTNLNGIAKGMGIDTLLETDLQATHSRGSIAGNALEAVFGAMYLDIGFAKTNKYIMKLIDRFADLEKVEDQESDFKSRLFEEAHKLKCDLYFRTYHQESKGNEKVFRAEVFLAKEKLGEGIGSSKKKAEQAAAKKGLHSLNATV